MARAKRYQLLCPIARSLDILGDRWTLLILRDLHAGPAGFKELATGLGLATNLLSTRLTELSDAGLIAKPGSARRSSYALTELGEQTADIIFELSRFGSLLPPDLGPREPGNVRAVVLPLRRILEETPSRPRLVARLVIDDTSVVVSSSNDVGVHYGDDTTTADITVSMTYQAFVDLSEGRLSLAEFGKSHLDVIDGSEHLAELVALFSAALS